MKKTSNCSNSCRKYILVILVSGIFSSCAIYTSQVIPPVTLEKENQLQLDIGGSLAYGAAALGIYGSAAYSFSDHFYGQVFGSYILDDAKHFDASIGWNHWFDNGGKVDMQAGYFYGGGKATDSDIMREEDFIWRGHYQGPYLKPQFSASFDDGKVLIGVNIKTGLFIPQLTRTVEVPFEPEMENEFPFEEIYGDKESTFTNNGILVEPGLFLIKKIDDQSNIYINASICYIHALVTDYYHVRYNGWGDIGIGYSYTFDLSKKRNKQ